MSTFRDTVEANFQRLQDNICHSLEALDGEGEFREDLWSRPQGGGGRTRIIQGATIEKGGVNFSSVHGEVTAEMSRSLLIDGKTFFATGVSIVLHPRSPMTPIIHMNVRYFEMDDGATWWFGGGIDLTPHYVHGGLAAKFHSHLQGCCDRHDSEYYPRFKAWADDYFYIKHRSETRGIGGIFFDHLGKHGDLDRDAIFRFVLDVGDTFVPAYSEQMRETKDLAYGERQQDWQAHRRGRYAEFNLVWDRGTKFGLFSGGRTESILMSLPPQAKWTYDHPVEAGSEEERTLSLLKKGIDWSKAE